MILQGSCRCLAFSRRTSSVFPWGDVSLWHWHSSIRNTSKSSSSYPHPREVSRIGGGISSVCYPARPYSEANTPNRITHLCGSVRPHSSTIAPTDCTNYASQRLLCMGREIKLPLLH